MTQAALLVYGTHWCIDCRRAQRFLTSHQIPFEWIDIDRDRQAEQFVIQTNHGMRSVPTIVFQDGTTLTEPTNAQLSLKLGLVAPTPSGR
jgi:glutaredoxin